MSKKFLRSDYMRYSRLGKKRKKLQKWRRPKGRDNKIREKRFGYPKSPSVGYKRPSKDRGKLDGKSVLLIKNMGDLERVGENSVALLAKMGAKKKMEVVKKAIEMKIRIVNLSEGQNEA